MALFVSNLFQSTWVFSDVNNIIIMKKPFSFLLIGLLVSLNFSCEEELVIDDFPSFDRTYVHPFPGCDNTANPEENCNEWVEFIGGGMANILIGGGDIVHNRSFRVDDNDNIVVYDETGLSSLSEIVFEYINQDTLQRVADSSFWVLQD